MKTLKTWFKEQVENARLSLRHYRVIPVQVTRGENNYGVDYYREGNNKIPIACLESNGDTLRYTDLSVPQEQVENHACAFRALLGRATGMTIVKPRTAEDAKVMALRAHLLAS